MRLKNHLIAPLCAVAALAGASAYAEEPAAKEPSSVQSATAPVSATTETPRPPAPPVDRKKALEFGFRPGVVNGNAVFCKEVPIEGTRFTDKRCVRENQFSALLSQLQTARDAAMKNGCNGTAVCGNTQNIPMTPRMSMGRK